MTKECEGLGVYLDSNPRRVTTIRNNIYNTYMVTSEVYIGCLMVLLFALAVVIIPQKMREQHVPMILRQAEENLFAVIMRARAMTLLLFISLSGALTHLTNYYVEDVCLHTINEPKLISAFNVNMTDYYQYCLVSMIWFTTFPMVILAITTYLRDVSRYLCIPFVVTGLVFSVFIILIAFIAIFNMVVNGNSELVRWCHIYQIAALGIVQLLSFNYRRKYAKKDLLRSEEEELQV